jgi:hypothetical protein
VALGVNLLFRVGRKLLAEPLEDSGLLPGKYYRSQALGALEENDFPECLRYLKMAEAHRKAQARLVGQLLILRCRMLQEHHQRRVRTLEEMLRLEADPETVRRYQQIFEEEQKALQLLERYIREAQDLVKKPGNPTPSAPP